MNRVFLVLIFFLQLQAASAQQDAGKELTLQQCIETAQKNNIEVRQSGLLTDVAAVNYKQSRNNLLPNLNALVDHGINRGRSIDPFTNAYANQQISYASYGVGSNVILFNGNTLRNGIRQNAFALDAAKMDLQQLKDNLTLNVILAYLQVLNSEDVVAISKRSVEVTQKQIDRLEILNREGAINPPLLYDLKGQLKNDELIVVDNINALETAKLNLAQLMNVAYTPTMRLQREGLDIAVQQYGSTVNNIYATALDQLAIVKAAAFRKRSAEAALKAIKGLRYPVVSLNGNVNSNYSSAATRDVFLNATEVSTTNYVVVNGSTVPVMTKQNNYNSERIIYTNQLRNNVFSNVSVSLRLPIFNSYQVRNRIKLAKIDVNNFELAEENTKVQLRQDIEQAYLNMNNSWQRYKVLLEQVAAYSESFRAAEVRFNAGVGTSVDYIIAKNNLDRANVNLVIAKYDYILRGRILDFYNRK